MMGTLASCGGSGTPSRTPSSSSGAGITASSKPAPNSRHLQLAAAPNGMLSFIPSVLGSKSGTVAIAFTNNSQLVHNLTIASKHGTVLGATPTFQGGTQVLTIKLGPGRYTFYCSVPGHRAAGMHGTLVVR